MKTAAKTRPRFVAIKVTKCVCLVQIVQEYERAVIFRLGRLLEGGTKGPGQCPLCAATAVSYAGDIADS